MLLFASAAAAACPSSPADVVARAEAIAADWRAWDWARFDADTAELEASLRCADAVLSRADAGAVHLAFALVGARRKDLAATTGAFRSLLAADPTWRLAEDLGVPGSLLAEAWNDAHSPGPGGAVPLGGRGWLVDGVPARTLPADRPLVLQHDRPVETWYVTDGVVPPEVATRRARRQVAWGAAGAAALLSVAGFTVAGVAYQVYPDAPDPEGIEALNHAATVAGAAFGAASVGLSTVLVVARW